MISSSKQSISLLFCPCHYHSFLQTIDIIICSFFHLLFPLNGSLFINLLLPTFVMLVQWSLLFLLFFSFLFFSFLFFSFSNEHCQDVLCCSLFLFFSQTIIIKMFFYPSSSFSTIIIKIVFYFFSFAFVLFIYFSFLFWMIMVELIIAWLFLLVLLNERCQIVFLLLFLPFLNDHHGIVPVLVRQ